ncbi:MAG: crossover junction endodeoxyribonuclease RuvC [Chloroflexota bacterium]
MLVVGIDPGFATTGYGVVHENEVGDLSAVDYGVISTAPNIPTAERLLELHRRLLEVIKIHHPSSGAVEKLFFQRNVRTAMDVGQGRGIVLLSLAEEGIPIAEYTPMEVKQAVVGYGGADKNQVQQMVRVLLGLEDIPRPDDAADALAIAICHIHSSKYQLLTQM